MSVNRKKTPWASLGVFFCALLLSLSPDATANCPLPTEHKSAQLKKVIDGDTLELRDGRHLRLLGVNTPELSKKGRPAQPLAGEARDFTRQFLHGGELKLSYDKQRRDHYGRTLAHIYNHRGENLEAALLSAGLAFHIAVAPNFSLAECLARSEQTARKEKIGLWADGAWPVKHAAVVRPGDGGFVLLRGRVRKVEHSRRAIWLELDGPVALRLQAGRSWPQRQHWQGAQVEVKGWLVDRGAKYSSRHPQHKRWFIAVDSPYTLNIKRN